MNKSISASLFTAFWVVILVACQASPVSPLEPSSEPAITSEPAAVPTLTPKLALAPTSTLPATPSAEATEKLAPTTTTTSEPVGEVDTGMGGSLSIKGVVKDDQGNVAPGVSVQLTVYGQAGGFDIGVFGNWFLYTDEKGDYSFMNLLRLERGHYEVWFNGGKEYGKVFENSGYYIQDNEISVDTCLLNVIVHPVTGSTFSGVVQYQDVDDSIKSFYSPAFPKSEPGHVLSIVRGTPNKPEYNIGAEYYKITGNTTEWQGLAGGTYFLEFTYRRMDGVLVNCKSPSFEIPPGQTRHFEYTIQDCPPVPVSEPVLP